MPSGTHFGVDSGALPRSDSPTLGVFGELTPTPESVLRLCERVVDGEGLERLPDGRTLRVRPHDRAADQVLSFQLPVWPKHAGKMPWWKRRWARLTGSYKAWKTDLAFEWLSTPRERTTLLMYEPEPIAEPFLAPGARYASRVFAPSAGASRRERATPLRLPSWWSIGAPLDELRREQPANETRPLVVVSSGKSALPGHRERLAFLGRLRRAGVPFDLFGRGLPESLRPLGAVADKGEVLRGARFTLAIENHAAGDLYVSEKLWDPLICWSVPLYYGPRAADALVPGDSFIRIPDLGEAGVRAVQAALGDADARRRRLEAIAAARASALGELRLMAWASRELFARGF